jgi:hypothetical protein
MRCEARRVAPEDFGRRVGTLLKRDGPRLVYFGSTFTVCVIETGCSPQKSL